MFDSETIAALQSGALILRDFVTVYGKDGEGVPVTFGFWTGEDAISVGVIGATDGDIDIRNFIGEGTIVDVPPIVDAIGIEVRSLEVGLSQIHVAVQDMVRGHNIRHAVAELHRGLFDPATWLLVSDPAPRFLGRADKASVNTPAVGSEGSVGLSLVTDSVDLTRSNPALKSDETQRLRSGDRFRRYADAAGQLEVWWGQAKGTA